MTLKSSRSAGRGSKEGAFDDDDDDEEAEVGIEAGDEAARDSLEVVGGGGGGPVLDGRLLAVARSLGDPFGAALVVDGR